MLTTELSKTWLISVIKRMISSRYATSHQSSVKEISSLTANFMTWMKILTSMNMILILYQIRLIRYKVILVPTRLYHLKNWESLTQHKASKVLKKGQTTQTIMMIKRFEFENFIKNKSPIGLKKELMHSNLYSSMINN